MYTNHRHAPLSQVEAQLLDLQRQALLGSISTIIAHEFNNLLTPVLARAEDALSQDTTASMRKALDCTVTQTQRAVDIARRLLDLSQPSARGGPDLTLDNCLLQQAVDDAVLISGRPFAKDNIDFQLQVPQDLTVLADRVLLEQVLLNLLIPARSDLAGQPGARIHMSAETHKGQALIEFSHNARSAAEHVERALAPLSNNQPWQWDSANPRLSACRTIIHLHGGQIEVQPQQRGGYSYRIRWPREAID